MTRIPFAHKDIAPLHSKLLEMRCLRIHHRLYNLEYLDQIVLFWMLHHESTSNEYFERATILKTTKQAGFTYSGRTSDDVFFMHKFPKEIEALLNISFR